MSGLEGVQQLGPAVQRVLVVEGRSQDAAEASIQIAWQKRWRLREEREIQYVLQQ